jgi:hypothetical protein
MPMITNLNSVLSVVLDIENKISFVVNVVTEESELRSIKFIYFY